MNSLSQTLEQAVRFHKAGNLQHAEQLYRQILQADPHNADALHLLGLIARQLGKNDLAVDYIQQALRCRPDYFEAYNNLGNALKDLGKLDEAIANYRNALQLKSDFYETYNNLGNALKDQGKLDEAIANLRQALRLKPNAFEAYNNLGTVLKEQGKLDEAIANYNKALQLNPDYARAYNNLGIGLKEQGKIDEAIANFRQALRLNPDYSKAYNNLGIVLRDLGRFEEAVANFQCALKLEPNFIEARNNLGMVLRDQGEHAEAISEFQHCLQLKPDYIETYINLGAVLQEQWLLEEAITNYQHALRINPDCVQAYNNLGNAFKDLGKLEDAIASYRHALQLKPDHISAHDGLLMTLHYVPEVDSASLYREARQWHTQHAEPLAKYRQPHANSAEAERRMRVGYVSPDFRNHPVAYSLVPLFSNHDRDKVEVFCYEEVARQDHITERLRLHADVWRSTLGLTDGQVAEVVRQDKIDILVDLALHSANNRLLVFARKPAPVQVTWCGYPGTTGLSTIDYRLTDPYLDPPGENDSCYSEQSFRLPATFWLYEPLIDPLPVSELPALSNGFLTFGCLNNFCKVNDGVLDLWAKVMRAVPGSRLLLMAPHGQTRDDILKKLKTHGIEEPRVEFANRQLRKYYFQSYNWIDLCLDTLPYNGHTTSLDAVWMGVPTVTLVGKTVVGRAGWSLLSNLRLTELAARTPEEYIEITRQLAGNLPKLQELRATLRERMQASPLMDRKRFARNLEQAFREMWRKWCEAGKA